MSGRTERKPKIPQTNIIRKRLLRRIDKSNDDDHLFQKVSNRYTERNLKILHRQAETNVPDADFMDELKKRTQGMSVDELVHLFRPQSSFH